MTAEIQRPGAPSNGDAVTNALLADEALWSEALSAYGDLLDDQLEEERRRKTSLEQRGHFVITTAGTLVSLLFGLAAVVTSRKSWVIPPDASLLLFIAVTLFALAALGGLVANLPLRYGNADHRDLRRLFSGEFWMDGVWVSPPSPALRRTAEFRVDLIECFRRKNQVKARAVVSALLAEVIAVGFLTAAVAVILS